MMLKKLRRRLIIIFTALTGSVVTAVLIVSLILAIDQRNLSISSEMMFGASVSTYGIIEEQKVDIDKLQAYEKENQKIIYIQKDGELLPLEHGWMAETDFKELSRNLADGLEGQQGRIAIGGGGGEEFDANYGIAIEQNSDQFITETEDDTSKTGLYAQTAVLSVASYEFFSPMESVKGENGNKYYYCALAYTDSYYEDYQIVVLEPAKEIDLGTMRLVAFYIALMLVSVALLFFISQLVAKIILKSTEEGLKKQAEFVAAASHELRSPLAVVGSCLSAVEVADTKEDAEKYHMAAKSETERMGRLVEDLLFFAGNNSGRWKLTQGEVDMDTVLIETSDQYMALAKEKGTKLILRLPDKTLGVIFGDKDRVHQILTVLLNNALEYATDDVGIILSAKKEKSKIAVSVIDHGKGIPDDEKAKVFDRFYRRDQSRSDKTHFGLGLPVASELAELHGGTLIVKDTPGGGATFVLKLPVEKKKQMFLKN